MDEINLGNQKSVGKLIKVDKRAIYASVLLMYITFKRLFYMSVAYRIQTNRAKSCSHFICSCT